jgi:hypothetical protein
MTSNTTEFQRTKKMWEGLETQNSQESKDSDMYNKHRARRSSSFDRIFEQSQDQSIFSQQDSRIKIPEKGKLENIKKNHKNKSISLSPSTLRKKINNVVVNGESSNLQEGHQTPLSISKNNRALLSTINNKVLHEKLKIDLARSKQIAENILKWIGYYENLGENKDCDLFDLASNVSNQTDSLETVHKNLVFGISQSRSSLSNTSQKQNELLQEFLGKITHFNTTLENLKNALHQKSNIFIHSEKTKEKIEIIDFISTDFITTLHSFCSKQGQKFNRLLIDLPNALQISQSTAETIFDELKNYFCSFNELVNSYIKTFLYGNFKILHNGKPFKIKVDNTFVDIASFLPKIPAEMTRYSIFFEKLMITSQEISDWYQGQKIDYPGSIAPERFKDLISFIGELQTKMNNETLLINKNYKREENNT